MNGNAPTPRPSTPSLLERLDRVAFPRAVLAGLAAGAAIGLAAALSGTPAALMAAGAVAMGALVVGLLAEPRVEWSEPGGSEALLPMVDVPAGRFLMGSPDTVDMAYGDEKPQHEVRLPAFRAAATPVTRAQYAEVIGKAPGKGAGDEPVTRVSWHDAVAFCNALSEREGFTPCYRIEGEAVELDRSQDGYRLPTEAEWERAARAGTTTRWWSGDDEEGLGRVAWYDANSGGKPHPVARLKPNPWGLYDVHGNVWEWCEDWFASYDSAPASDPTGPPSGEDRVVRGGSFGDVPWVLRAACRYWFRPEDRLGYLGFRCVRRPRPPS